MPILPRLKSKLYMFNMCLSSLWMVPAISWIVLRRAHIRPDGQCSIDIAGAGPMLGLIVGLDVCLNGYYTSLFAWPLLRGDWHNPQLRRLAVKTCIASALCMVGTGVNIAVYAAEGGVELAQVMMTTCALDTTWCAFVICILTKNRDSSATTNSNTNTGSGSQPRFKPPTAPLASFSWISAIKPSPSVVVEVERTGSVEVDDADDSTKDGLAARQWPIASSPV